MWKSVFVISTFPPPALVAIIFIRQPLVASAPALLVFGWAEVIERGVHAVAVIPAKPFEHCIRSLPQKLSAGVP